MDREETLLDLIECALQRADHDTVLRIHRADESAESAGQGLGQPLASVLGRRSSARSAVAARPTPQE